MDNQTYLDFDTSVGKSFYECFMDKPDFKDMQAGKMRGIA
jgi:hypothetical protein